MTVARSFHYFRIENFPKLELGQQVRSGGQAVFEDYPIRGAHSEITYLGVSEYDAFTKYKVIHETKKTYRHRVDGDIRNTLIAVSEFHLFRHRNGYFMADTNAKEVRELANRLGQAYPESLLLLMFRTVDLRSLHEDILRVDADTSVIGGFFHQLRVDRVSSATIFGHEVGESPLWDEFETKGELGGLMLNFEFYGDLTSAMITKSGGIVLYSAFGESLALELVENLNKVIEPHSEESSTSTRRRGRQ
jgi:hypothetical protein